MKIFIYLISLIPLVLISCKNDQIQNKNEASVFESAQYAKTQSGEPIHDAAEANILKDSFSLQRDEEQISSVLLHERDANGFPIFSEDDKSAEVFGSCFSQKIPAYEFIIRNPILEKDIYIEKLDSVKNKILRIEHEDYDFRNGLQLWNGDGEDRSKFWKYYCFDSEGHVSDYYFINKTVDEKNWIYTQKHIKYHCDGSRYYISTHIIKTDNIERNEIKDTVYAISKDNESVTLIKITDDYPRNSKYIFGKDLVTNIFGSSFDNKDVYKYSGTKIEFTHYLINSKEEEKESHTMIFDKGLLIKTSQPTTDGLLINTYMMDGDEGQKHYSEEKDGKIIYESTGSYILAKHNEVGFIEKFRIDPLTDNTSGEYVFEDSELLDKPDEILQEYFGL